VRTLVSAFLRVPDRSTRHRLTRRDDDFDEREEEAAIAPATTRPVMPRPAPISTIRG
jgi:hypothetical protein